MKKAYALFVLVLSLSVLPAAAWGGGDGHFGKGEVQRFVTLPEGVSFPEGITVDPDTGEIYVGTFDFTPGANRLLRYSRRGRLLAVKEFSDTPLLGLAFNPLDHKVYICNAGALVGDVSRIQRIPAAFTSGTPVEEVADIPSIGSPPDRAVPNPDLSEDMISFGNNAPAPNAMAFNKAGDLFVSDSFQGAVFRIDDAQNCSGCTPATVIHHALLATAGFPPFGANGLALNEEESLLFVANTGDDRVLKLTLASGALDPFSDSINGADGMAFGKGGVLWVVANQRITSRV